MLPNLTATLLPSGGLIGNKPKGSIAEGVERLIILCLLLIGVDDVTVILFIEPMVSTDPVKHDHPVKFPFSKSRLFGHSDVVLEVKLLCLDVETVLRLAIVFLKIKSSLLF